MSLHHQSVERSEPGSSILQFMGPGIIALTLLKVYDSVLFLY